MIIPVSLLMEKNSPGVNDDGSVSSLSDNDNDADCNEGQVLSMENFYFS